MNTLIQDMYVAFAGYATSTAIEKQYNKGNSNLEGYERLKQRAIDEGVYTDTPFRFDNYVIGPNIEAVARAVNNFVGYYLFLDYGEINCAVDGRNIHRDRLKLAVTVAYKVKEFNADMMEQLIVSSECLRRLAIIRDDMVRRYSCGSGDKMISDSHTFVPFLGRELSSIGWTMMFDRQGIDSFRVSY